MEITEAYAHSQAPNAGAIKNARGVVLKRKLVGLFHSPMARCSSAIAKEAAPRITGPRLTSPSRPNVFRCTLPKPPVPCKHSLALLYAHCPGSQVCGKRGPERHLRETREGSATRRKKKVEVEKPRQVNTSALTKKIEAQNRGDRAFGIAYH